MTGSRTCPRPAACAVTLLRLGAPVAAGRAATRAGAGRLHVPARPAAS